MELACQRFAGTPLGAASLLSLGLKTLKSVNGIQNKTIAHATFMSAIKKELLSKTMQPTDSPSTAVTKPKMTHAPSILHLALLLPGSVQLVPPPKNKNYLASWFWNNGTIVKNSYTINYQNKSYTSIYNTRKKSWTTGKSNQMSYVSYYSYLLDNNRPELENFIEYLVRRAVKFSPQTFNLSKEKVEEGCEQVEKLIKIFTKIILQEQFYRRVYGNKKYAVYYGGTGRAKFFSDFITALHRYLDIINEHKERSPYEDLKQYNSAYEFVIEKIIREEKSDNDVSPYPKAVNLVACGYLDWPGESSINFFCENNNVSSQCLQYLHVSLVEELCEQVGLLFTKQDLFDLHEEYRQLGGIMEQIFIDSKDIDTFSYPALPWGKPYFSKRPVAYLDNFTEKLAKHFTKKTTIETKDCEQITISTLLDFLCSEPEHECWMTSTGSKKYDFAINQLQGRLLHFSPLFFGSTSDTIKKPKIFNYYTDKQKEALHKKLQEKMDVLVKSMVLKTLKDGHLKITGTKLQILQKNIADSYFNS